MIRKVISLCAVVPSILALSDISFAAAPPTPYAPIEVKACRLFSNRAGSRIGLDFINRAAVAANEVHFTIVYAGVSHNLVDRGTFSQGVLIAHMFPAYYDMLLGRTSADKCYADYVHFKDGTTWQAH